MPVYVDPLMKHGGSPSFPWKESCHMWADTDEELFLLAARIGMKPQWVQRPLAKPGASRRFTHFDLTAPKRALAVAKGAIDFKTHREAHIMRGKMGIISEKHLTFALSFSDKLKEGTADALHEKETPVRPEPQPVQVSRVRVRKVPQIQSPKKVQAPKRQRNPLEPILSFTGKYRFLSNFFPSPIAVSRGTFTTVEHAYQAAKCANRADAIKIRGTESPAEVKRIGKTVPLVMGWEKMKLGVMREALRKKFRDDPLRSQLLATGNAHLEEGNTWGDTFWGTCGGKGENHLGRLLMEIREKLRMENECKTFDFARASLDEPYVEKTTFHDSKMEEKMGQMILEFKGAMQKAPLPPPAFLELQCPKCKRGFGGTTRSNIQCPGCGWVMPADEQAALGLYVAHLRDLPQKRPIPAGKVRIRRK